jgi:hypothetical protein
LLRATFRISSVLKKTLQITRIWHLRAILVGARGGVKSGGAALHRRVRSRPSLDKIWI